MKKISLVALLLNCFIGVGLGGCGDFIKITEDPTEDSSPKPVPSVVSDMKWTAQRVAKEYMITPPSMIPFHLGQMLEGAMRQGRQLDAVRILKDTVEISCGQGKKSTLAGSGKDMSEQECMQLNQLDINGAIADLDQSLAP